MNNLKRQIKQSDPEEIIKLLGIDLAGRKYQSSQLYRGMLVECEHTTGPTAVTHKLSDVAKIAMAHLDESPDYYEALDKMEQKLEKGIEPALLVPVTLAKALDPVGSRHDVVSHIASWNVRRVPGRGGSYVSGQLTTHMDETPDPVAIGHKGPNGWSFLEGKPVPMNQQTETHELMHALYSKDVLAGRKALERFSAYHGNPKSSGATIDSMHEHLMELGKFYAHDPDTLKKHAPELHDIAHEWLGPNPIKSVADAQSRLQKGLGGFESQKAAWSQGNHPLTTQKGRTMVKQHWRKGKDGQPVLVHEHWTTVSKADREQGKQSELVQSREVALPQGAQQIPSDQIQPHWQNRSPNYVHFTLPDQPEHHEGYYVSNSGEMGYHYSQQFKQKKELEKFDRAAHMATVIGEIIADSEHLMAHPLGSKERAIGTIISLIDRHCMRVGGEESRNEREHYGVTTLEPRHVIPQGKDYCVVNFTGKSGHEWERSIDNGEAKTILNLMKHAESPTDLLWKYKKPDGQWTRVNQQDIREVLKPYGVTPKDFRTYHACRLTFYYMHELAGSWPGDQSDPKQREKLVQKAIEQTADHLNHTPAVCRTNYVSDELYRDYIKTGELPGATRFTPTTLEKSWAGRWMPGERDYVDWLVTRTGRVRKNVKLVKGLVGATFTFSASGAIDIEVNK